MIKAATLLIKNVSFNLMADASDRIGNYVLVILISRMLDPKASGIYSISLTYFSIGLLISYWGLGNILTREVAKDQNSFGRFFSNAIVLRMGFSILTFIAIISFLQFANYDQETNKIIFLLTVSILPGSLNQLISAAFMAFEKIKYLSIVSMILSVVKICLGFVFLNSNGGLFSIALLLMGCEYLALLVNSLLARKYLPEFIFQLDFNFCLKLIKIAFPMFGLAIVMMLDTKAETIIVSLLLGETSVGFYTAANTILGIFILFPESIRYAALPLLARHSLSTDGKFNRIIMTLFEFLVLVTTPIVIIVFIFSSDLIHLIFTQKFSSSILILQIIVWSLISYSLTMLCSISLIAIVQEKIVAKATLFSAIITNTLNLVVAPSFGLWSVACVRLGTSILLFLVCAYFLRKMGHPLIRFSFVWRISLTGLLMVGGMTLLFHYEKWAALITGIIIYLAGLFFLGLVRRQDITRIRDIAQALSPFSRNNHTNSDS